MLLTERTNDQNQAVGSFLSQAYHRLHCFRQVENPRAGVHKLHYQQTGRTLPAITETEQEDESSELLNPNKKLEAVTLLLSRKDIDLNRVGMQTLLVMTKTRVNGPGPRVQASHAIVYGGGKTEEGLRKQILSFLRDEDDDTDDLIVARRRTSDVSCSESECGRNEDEDATTSTYNTSDDESGPMGKQWGVLHQQALHVVANALEQILLSDDATDALPLDFKDPFWRRVVDSICHNVEWCHSTDVTGWALKVLRLLHTFEPVLVTPLLRHTLLPYLAYLEDYGKQRRAPMVESEAAKLMRRADVVPSNRVEI